jgi:hypothetical protein
MNETRERETKMTTNTQTKEITMTTHTSLTDLDIRDIEMGATYWVVVNETGRCLLSESFPMFKAAWRTEKGAKAAAKKLGGKPSGFLALKQIKN